MNEGKSLLSGMNHYKYLTQGREIKIMNTLNIHFFTELENLDRLEKGEVIEVWNKSEAKETDVHISVDYSKCNIFPTKMRNIFKLDKRIWLINVGLLIILSIFWGERELKTRIQKLQYILLSR